MAYRAAVCEDNGTDAGYLLRLLEEWAGLRSIRLFAERFCSAEGFLFRYEEEKAFDLLLLDIEMGEMDGVSLAKRVRSENAAVQIVFVTGYSDYIAEGYEVAALHYLMKPVEKEKLFSVLDRAFEKKQQAERSLLLMLPDGMVRIPLREIRYLQVRQNYVTLHAAGEYTVKRPLSSFEKELDERFFRVGRGLIVNLCCVRRVTKTQLVLSDGTVLPLPRGAYEPLNRAIIAMN